MGSALAYEGAARALRDGRWLPVGLALLLWLVPSLDYIHKFTGQVGLLTLPLIALAALLVLTALRQRRDEDISTWWIVAFCAAAVVLFIVLYPIANSGALGPGSDRDDGLNVALQALLAGNYPYGVRTYLGNTPTPMPGALLLALPFYLLGNSALQNLVWLPIFAWWCLRRFESTAATFLVLAIFVIGCPAAIGDFVTGGDYLINAIYVAIAMDVVLLAQDAKQIWWRHTASVFLAIAISSRPVYAVAVMVLAGSIFRTAGIRRMLEFLIVVGTVAAMLNGPLFLYDPARFPTAQLSGKLAVFPPSLHAAILLPALGTAIACLSFLMRMTGDGIFGLMSAALAAMFYPVFLVDLVTSAFDADTLWTASYSLPVSIFGGLWICGKFGLRSKPAVDGVGPVMVKDAPSATRIG